MPASPFGYGPGWVLACDIHAPIDTPPFTNSAMDGYALHGKNLANLPGPEMHLTVIGQSLAGHPFAGAGRRGQCVRIMTGAVLPEGCATVLRQEDVCWAGGPAPGGPSAGARAPSAARRDRAVGLAGNRYGQRVAPAGGRRANCFIVLPPETGRIDQGQEVEVFPFNTLYWGLS